MPYNSGQDKGSVSGRDVPKVNILRIAMLTMKKLPPLSRCGLSPYPKTARVVFGSKKDA